ncbi:DUF6644 family protein [Pontibacter burrus]|uniref:DUF6644 family protein n=1 Tax=Pontibacter burrus TaxID=2704466 RepID=UPI00293C033B|nr:DUF6644 family protein [Pontibacter burrus]
MPVPALGQYLLPWSGKGLYLIIPSGLPLFSTNAVALVNDPVFYIKLIILIVGALNAGFFHRFLAPSSPKWEHDYIPRSARTVALCSIVVWVIMIACGRLLTY